MDVSRTIQTNPLFVSASQKNKRERSFCIYWKQYDGE